MTTRTECLEAYKKAIKTHYEIEKKGKYSSFLINPSRAKLRQLCEERLKESDDKNDRLSFKLVFGFEYEATNRNKLKTLTDKFRPIENFFKGDTDLADIETINIAALLVDFKTRPFKIFVTKFTGIETIELENTTTKSKDAKQSLKPDEKKNLKKKSVIGVISLLGLFSIGYTINDLTINKKECIQWQIDHYEYVDCNKNSTQGFAEIPIELADEQKAQLKKIEVNENTTFFIHDKPVVWYYKVNGKPEFFNMQGFHPITGKPLKPITKYMIDKWVKKNER